MRELAGIILQLEDAKGFTETRAQLAAILKLMGDQVRLDGETMSRAQDPIAFAYFVHSIADKLADVSASWAALSVAVRDSSKNSARSTSPAMDPIYNQPCGFG